MARKIIYWVTTVLLAAMSLLGGYAYLSGSPQVVQAFTHVGYPQQLRVILGIAICAFFAHYLAKDGPVAYEPLVLLLILAISYLTRPASRQCQAKVAPIESTQKP